MYGVFVEVCRPINLTKLIGCRYVFKTMMKNGRVDKYKARMVAKGYSQVRERDYNETFAPVARMNSLRIFLKLSVTKGHVRRSIDFTAAYLQAVLPEDLYLDTPEGMTCREGHVLKLLKSIYGLKQAGRYWYVLLKLFLTEEEKYTCCASDHCIFTSPDLSVLVLIYVDDVIISGASDKLIDNLIRRLRAKFEIGEEGPVDYFLGMSVEDTGKEVRLSQSHYVQKIIDRCGYGDLSEVDTPMAEGLSITKDPDDELFEGFDIIAMNFATKEIIWMRGLLTELGVDMSLPTKLLCDNMSAIKLAHNPVFHKRTKHIMLKFALLVEQMKLDNLILEFVRSAENLADMFTKAQKSSHFLTNLQRLKMESKTKK